uniref:Uncharacterized protein n=1 Tax=Oryzias sinensis TaxID=183150 RepID=A0A8C7XSX0_9TELE
FISLKQCHQLVYYLHLKSEKRNEITETLSTMNPVRTDDQQLEATRPSWHTLMVNTGKGYAGGQLGNVDTNILVQYKHPNPILVND